MTARRITKPSRSRTRPRWLLALGLIAVLLAVTGWVYWLKFRPAPAATGPLEHVTTGLIGEYAALVWVADSQGYFKTNGLDVTIKRYPSGPASLADLLAGKVDTALASDFAGVRNSFGGQDLKILATVSKSEAFDLVGRRDHGLEHVADLKGKRIGITRQTVGEFYLGQFLAFNRLSVKDIELVDLPQDKLVSAIKDGSIDAAVLFEPNAYNARTALGANAQRWSVQSGQSIYTLLYSTGKFVSTRPQTAQRYLKALIQAEQFIRDHQAEARTVVAKRLEYDARYIDYIWPKFSFAVSLDQELLLNMDDEARWAIENNLASNAGPPNYLHLIYLPSLEAVRPDSITIIH